MGTRARLIKRIGEATRPRVPLTPEIQQETCEALALVLATDYAAMRRIPYAEGRILTLANAVLAALEMAPIGPDSEN